MEPNERIARIIVGGIMIALPALMLIYLFARIGTDFPNYIYAIGAMVVASICGRVGLGLIDSVR